ncbi:MAG: FAD-dependent monooxygenase [Burkholderiales bacterium]
MTHPFDVCIRGAGIVGSTLALLLARERLRVALVSLPRGPRPSSSAAAATPAYVGPATPTPAATPREGEQSSSEQPGDSGAARPDDAPAGARPDPADGHGDVRAYALNAASQDALTSLRCWPEGPSATAVRAMQVFGDDGGAVTFGAKGDEQGALAWIVDVPALEQKLAEAVREQALVEQVADAPPPAPLTVICEGRVSASRDALAVEYDVTPYGQHAIATRLSCEKPHGAIARQWFNAGRILALLPLGGAEGREVAVVWSVADSDMPQLMALLPEEFAARLEEASHHSLGKLTVTHHRAAWPLQLAQARRFIGQFKGSSAKKPRNFALAGDAAHTVHPLAGQGLNLGLADATCLAKVLRERDYWRSVGDEKLLRRYERSRKAGLLPMQSASDGMQRLFAHGGDTAQALRNWGMWGFERSGPLKAWAVRQAMGL